MLNKIILFSVKNKLTIGVGTLMLIIWGSFSLSKLPIDAVPDITDNQVQIITTSPSLAAPEVERLISFPIELKMANIPHLTKVRSFSRFGLSVVTIVFEESIDIYWARQQVSERLQQLQNEIPQNIGVPEMAPITTGLGEIYQYVVEADKEYRNQYTLQDLRNIQDWVIRRQLLGTPGVADVSALGGKKQQFEIALSLDKISALGISISEVFKALQENNDNTGGAYIEKNDAAYFIRSEGFVGSLRDIEQIVVKSNGSSKVVLVKDIADVSLGHAVRYGASSRNGQGEVVSAIVMMVKGANSSLVIENVKKKIEEIKKTLPEGIKITPFLDRTSLVDRAIGTVEKNLIEGALIVIFVLLLILGNFRAGLIVASVIPLALMFAFGMMHLFGVSGNLMSLGAIDFGLIVDGAVIIVEASLHHLSMKRFTQKLTQEEMDQEIYISSSKIRNSAAFGEIIILIVYIPLLALVGTEGKMFRPMAQTVSFAIMGAFILSLTYVPMISALFLSKETSHKVTKSDQMVEKVQSAFESILRKVLIRKKMVMVISIFLLFISLWRFTCLGGEFIPTLDEGDLAVQATLLTGSSLTASLESSQKAEKLLLKNFPEVKQVVSKIGSGEIPTDPMPIEAADIMIVLKDKSEWVSANSRETLVDSMSKVLSDIKGVNFSFQQPIQMRFNELMTGVRQDVAVKIFGEDLEQLSQYAKQLGEIIRGVRGAEDVYVEEVTGVPQIVIDFDREVIARYQLDINSINQQINMAFAGASAGKVYQGERWFDMVIRLKADERLGIESVMKLPIMTQDQGVIPLSILGKVSLVDGPYQIQRDDTKRRIIVAFNVRNADVETVVGLVKNEIDKKIQFQPGYSVTFGGQFENLMEAKQRLMIAVPMALLLIFILLYVTFKSVGQSILIFTAIPFSAIGGIWALSLRGMPFSISAGVGFIALFGVAVLNGIVLISEFNYLKNNGINDIKDRIISGTRNRIRPVLMTAAVASLGFLPMAISSSAGAEVQKPLATVVIGGLVSATILTLMVLPILYLYFERGLNRKPKPALMLAILILGLPRLGLAQEHIQIKDLNQAIEFAIRENREIKSKQWMVKSAQSKLRSSIDIPATSVDWMQGQYNSIFSNDQHFSVGQTFQNPLMYYQQHQSNKVKVQFNQLELKLEEARVKKSIKGSWSDYINARKKIEVLTEKKKAYQKLAETIKTRIDLGDAIELDLNMAFSHIEGLQLNIKEQEVIQRNIYLTLKNELHLKPEDTILISMDQDLLISKHQEFSGNLGLSLLKSDLALRNRNVKLEQSMLFPNFRFSYFNQSLNGPSSTIDGREVWYNSSDRFTGMSFGLDIPLLSIPSYFNKVQALKQLEKASEAHLEYFSGQVLNLWKQKNDQLEVYESRLLYYNQNLLPLSVSIESQLLNSYQKGAISFMELTRGMDQVWEYRLQYIQVQNEYQSQLIELEFITQN